MGKLIATIAAMILTKIKAATLLEIIVAGGSLASLVDTIMAGGLKEQAEAIIIAEVANKAGLHLAEENPLSDASLAGAVGERLGVPIRSLRDRTMIEEDVDAYLAGRLSEKIGYQISSLRNTDRLRTDLEVAALGIVTAKTGIPLTPPAPGETLTPDAIKEQVKDWARAAIMAEAQEKGAAALELLSGPMADFEAVAEEMNRKLEVLGSENRVTATMLAMKVSETLVKESVPKFQRAAIVVGRRNRRQLQNRESQARFRQSHGNRNVYVPLGIEKPEYQPIEE